MIADSHSCSETGKAPPVPMDDTAIPDVPRAVPSIETDTQAVGFTMASDRQTGSLLRSLVATKPGGRILELGTGTGLSTAWILDGMDDAARLTTVDNDPACVAIAKKWLSHDTRVKFVVEDGAAVLTGLNGREFDLIFADTWPGKIREPWLALDLLAKGGVYIVDDMLPQPSWPEGHGAKVDSFLEFVESRNDLVESRMAWSTGIMIATRKPAVQPPAAHGE